MRTYLFDDWGSVWHSLLGFILYLLAPGIVIVLTTLVFLIYEAHESEDPVCTVGDVVEFLVGAILGIVVRCVGFI